MNLVIEAADVSEVEAIAALYDALCDELEAHTNYPGWRKGIYPTMEDARRGVRTQTLFVARVKGHIAGTIVLNHHQEDAYRGMPWAVAAADEKVMVVHTFAVHPAYAGQGIGSALLDFAKEHATREGMESLRLDVYVGNAPAIRLYERAGYTCVGEADLGYGKDYGLDAFKLYELPL